MNNDIILKALKKIVLDPSVLNNLSLPNVNFPTMGGQVFWNTLAEYNGWRVQQNTLTQHCRILDPDDVRRAWGGADAMEKLFKKLSSVD